MNTLEALAAASALPGPIAVKMSVMIGAQTAGVPGAIAVQVRWCRPSP